MTKPVEPVWIETELALAIHDRQLAEHGGPIGLRDASALESALARARNQWTYGETDLCALAAAYAYGVARNHPFTDGNAGDYNNKFLKSITLGKFKNCAQIDVRFTGAGLHLH